MSVLPDLAVAYLHVGVVQISVANLIVIGAMIVVFILALVLPFPHGRDDAPEDRHDNR
jgi:hypothetical protein